MEVERDITCDDSNEHPLGHSGCPRILLRPQHRRSRVLVPPWILYPGGFAFGFAACRILVCAAVPVHAGIRLLLSSARGSAAGLKFQNAIHFNKPPPRNRHQRRPRTDSQTEQAPGTDRQGQTAKCQWRRVDVALTQMPLRPGLHGTFAPPRAPRLAPAS